MGTIANYVFFQPFLESLKQFALLKWRHEICSQLFHTPIPLPQLMLKSRSLFRNGQSAASFYPRAGIRLGWTGHLMLMCCLVNRKLPNIATSQICIPSLIVILDDIITFIYIRHVFMSLSSFRGRCSLSLSFRQKSPFRGSSWNLHNPPHIFQILTQ